MRQDVIYGTDHRSKRRAHIACQRKLMKPIKARGHIYAGVFTSTPVAACGKRPFLGDPPAAAEGRAAGTNSGGCGQTLAMCLYFPRGPPQQDLSEFRSNLQQPVLPLEVFPGVYAPGKMFSTWKDGYDADAGVSSERTSELLRGCAAVPWGEGVRRCRWHPAAGGAPPRWLLPCPTARRRCTAAPGAGAAGGAARPACSWEKGFPGTGKKKKKERASGLAWLLSSLRPISSGGRKKTAVSVGPP